MAVKRLWLSLIIRNEELKVGFLPAVTSLFLAKVSHSGADHLPLFKVF